MMQSQERKGKLSLSSCKLAVLKSVAQSTTPQVHFNVRTSLFPRQEKRQSRVNERMALFSSPFSPPFVFPTAPGMCRCGCPCHCHCQLNRLHGSYTVVTFGPSFVCRGDCCSVVGLYICAPVFEKGNDNEALLALSAYLTLSTLPCLAYLSVYLLAYLPTLPCLLNCLSTLSA